MLLTEAARRASGTPTASYSLVRDCLVACSLFHLSIIFTASTLLGLLPGSLFLWCWIQVGLAKLWHFLGVLFPVWTPLCLHTPGPQLSDPMAPGLAKPRGCNTFKGAPKDPVWECRKESDLIMQLLQIIRIGKVWNYGYIVIPPKSWMSNITDPRKTILRNAN